MRFQLRCVHDIRINLNVIYASSVLMFVRFTHQGISFNLEGCPQAIADGGWGQPEKELQTRWPLLTYGEGEGEVLSLINHSFGDGPTRFSVYIFTCIRSQPLLILFFHEETGSRRGKQRNKRTHPPLPCLFFICAIARQSWVFGDFRPFGDYRPLPRLFAHNYGGDLRRSAGFQFGSPN